MKNALLAIIALYFAAHSLAQSENKITLGTIDSLPSIILKENRKVWVYVPSTVSNSVFSKKKYPVIYLLDGDAHFYSVVGMVQQLSQVNGNNVCPEMIVVGIPNTNRTRDLTPTNSGDDPFLKDGVDYFKKTSGGGEDFISFIEKELFPFIDGKYPTQPYKTLIGHSFGGLTVMNTLANHTRLFNSYICIDPSMWWSNLSFLASTKNQLTVKDFTGTSLYVGIANTMNEGMDIRRIQQDTSMDTRHIRSILEMDNFIKSKKPKGLNYASKYYPNDSHSSVPLITEYDALRFIFDRYNFRLDNKSYVDSTIALAEKFSRHYAEVSRFFGYEVKPPEQQINSLGYEFLEMKQLKKAEGLFKLNVANYPDSFNVYDSYGDFLLATGNKMLAIQQYKKALALRENPETKKKLDKLSE